MGHAPHPPNLKQGAPTNAKLVIYSSKYGIPSCRGTQPLPPQVAPGFYRISSPSRTPLPALTRQRRIRPRGPGRCAQAPRGGRKRWALASATPPASSVEGGLAGPYVAAADTQRRPRRRTGVTHAAWQPGGSNFFPLAGSGFPRPAGPLLRNASPAERKQMRKRGGLYSAPNRQGEKRNRAARR